MTLATDRLAAFREAVRTIIRPGNADYAPVRLNTRALVPAFARWADDLAPLAEQFFSAVLLMPAPSHGADSFSPAIRPLFVDDCGPLLTLLATDPGHHAMAAIARDLDPMRSWTVPRRLGRIEIKSAHEWIAWKRIVTALREIESTGAFFRLPMLILREPPSHAIGELLQDFADRREEPMAAAFGLALRSGDKERAISILDGMKLRLPSRRPSTPKYETRPTRKQRVEERRQAIIAQKFRAAHLAIKSPTYLQPP
ncbi:MAG TPA: hypothetical protein VNQ34_11630 [Xanthobacteraceae bacterium]|nr:hypothetical protein [Xanthobacteraceae bacterium]